MVDESSGEGVGESAMSGNDSPDVDLGKGVKQIPATAPAVVAPSPNTMRKRRHFEIAKKVEMRKALISTTSSSRLDMGKVHSILSGPRLSWDASKAASLSMRGGDHDEEDDSCGLIVEDFHADSRSALRTNISKALSQMASRDINTQQISTQENNSQAMHADEEIQRIIDMKKKLMKREVGKKGNQNHFGVVDTRTTMDDLVAELDDGIGENLPVLEPIDEEFTTQVDSGATQEFVRRPIIEENEMSPTQIFYREHTDDDHDDNINDEELDIDSLAMEPTQVYVAPDDDHEGPVRTQERFESKSSLASSNSSSALPPNTIREEVVDASSDSESGGSESDSEKSENEDEEDEEERPRVVEEVPRQIKKKDQMEFAEWLAARQQKKKRRREQGKDARMFFEAEAEESEDEELGGIMRRGKGGSSSDGSVSSDDGDSDLEDLVASAADEFVLEKKSGKDSKKLAKLHARWAEERDAALEKAIEDREFLRRKQLGSRSMLDDGVESGLNRMQRKLKAKRDAIVEQFDREGNLLAPEYVSDSDYDSMEIDSDDFVDEEDDEGDRAGELDPAELEARKERKQRELERRKKEVEFKLEMKKRRQLLKEKLRQERLMREKDKREIQSGVGIMNEEDREVFKLVNRSQVFGYTAGKDGGNTTQSTVASTVSSQFSFLGGGKPNQIMSLAGRRRSTTAGASLELE